MLNRAIRIEQASADATDGGAQGLGGHDLQPAGSRRGWSLHIVVEEEQQIAADLSGRPVVEQAPVEGLIQRHHLEPAAGALAPVLQKDSGGLQP